MSDDIDEITSRRLRLMAETGEASPPERFTDVKGYTDELLAQGLAGAAIRGEQRSARAGAQVERLMADRRRAITADNREAALKSLVDANGVTQYFTTCACRWHGLQVTDPELARREYDAHPCSAPSGDAIHRVYRGPIDKRPRSTMRPAFSLDEAVTRGTTTQQTDDTEQRMALLEIEGKE